MTKSLDLNINIPNDQMFLNMSEVSQMIFIML